MKAVAQQGGLQLKNHAENILWCHTPTKDTGSLTDARQMLSGWIIRVQIRFPDSFLWRFSRLLMIKVTFWGFFQGHILQQAHRYRQRPEWTEGRNETKVSEQRKHDALFEIMKPSWIWLDVVAPQCVCDVKHDSPRHMSVASHRCRVITTLMRDRRGHLRKRSTSAHSFLRDSRRIWDVEESKNMLRDPITLRNAKNCDDNLPAWDNTLLF